VDLVVDVDGEVGYSPVDARRNGYSGRSRQLARINLRCGTAMNLVFKFLESGTSVPATVQGFYFTFFLTDEREVLFVNGFDSYRFAKGSRLTYNVQERSLSVSLRPASHSAVTAPAPGDPRTTTETEEEGAVTVFFSRASEVQVGVVVTGPLLVDRGVDFLFAGVATLHHCHRGSASFWPERTREWCCRREGRGCIATAKWERRNLVGRLPFDCRKGTEETWLEKQRSWCCIHEGRACSAASAFEASGEAIAATTSVAPTPATAKVSGKEIALLGCRTGHSAGNSYSWSLSKRAWCCMQAGVACDGFYNCHTGDANWSDAKRTWCCTNQNMGCSPTIIGAAASFDCQARILNLESSWPIAQRAWCCAHKKRGCWGLHATTSTITSSTTASIVIATTSTATTSMPTTSISSTSPTNTSYCQGPGLLKHSREEKELCCKQLGIGCPSLIPPFDCDLNLANFEVAWAPGKRKWCCTEEGRGCSAQATTTTTSEPYDCLAGLAQWRTVWLVEKREWCCRRHPSLGCASAPTPAPAARAAGVLRSATTLVPVAAKIGTAAASGVASGSVAPTSTSPPFACRVGRQSAWSSGKTAWCCLYEHLGCAAVKHGTELRFDCESGLFNYARGWTYEKKEWCCVYGSDLVRGHLHDGLGCPTREASVSRTHQENFQKRFEQLHRGLPTSVLHPQTLAVSLVIVSVSFVAACTAVRSCCSGSAPRLFEARSRIKALGYGALLPSGPVGLVDEEDMGSSLE